MRLVLVGSGPGHLNFIRDKAKNLSMDVEVILISPTSQSFYKPAFSSVLSGKRNVHEAIVDLRKISTLSGVTFIQSAIEYIDTEKKLIKFTDRASIQFDFMSIEGIDIPKATLPLTGTEKHLDYIFQVHDYINFFHQLKELETALVEHKHYPYHVCVVGAGRTGVQLVLGLAERFRKFSSKITWELLEEQDAVLPDYHLQIRKRLEKELRAKDILFHTQYKVSAIHDHVIKDLKNPKKTFDGDMVFLTSGTQLPTWVKASHLPLTADGHLDAHHNSTLKALPFVLAAGTVAGQLIETAEIANHVQTLEKIANRQPLETKVRKAKPRRKLNSFQLGEKILQVQWGFLSEKEKPYVEFQTALNIQLEHLRGLKEQKLAQLTPQIDDNTYVDKFKKRLLLDLSPEQLDVIFSEKLQERFEIDNWCEKEYRDVFNDHYLSSFHMGLDIIDNCYTRGGKPKYLRLYVSAPSSIKDVEILSQILIGAYRACKGSVELRVHLCGQAMNTVQFSLGIEAGEISTHVPEPVAYIALTRPLGLYGLLSQQGKEGWEGQWLSDVWNELTLTEKNLGSLVESHKSQMNVFQLSESGFINDIVKNVGSEGSRVCLNLSKLPRWEGVDQILKRRPDDILLQNNWRKGFRYWSGQGERIPDSQYLLWEPHLIRPPACILVDPAYSKELSMDYKNKFNQKLIFIGYVEKTHPSEQTEYKLTDWSFENRLEERVAENRYIKASTNPEVLL